MSLVEDTLETETLLSSHLTSPFSFEAALWCTFYIFAGSSEVILTLFKFDGIFLHKEHVF